MTVKELRKEKNLSQAALAKELGIATSAVGHMENGRMKVSAKIAAKAKEVFGVDLVDAAAKTAPAATKPAAKKSAAKKAAAKKAAATPKAVKAEKAPAKKAAATKTEKAVKSAAKKATIKEAPMKKSSAAEKKLANKVIIQSPLGGVTTPDEVLAKVGNVDEVYVRVDQNKAYWVRGKEAGAVDLW